MKITRETTNLSRIFVIWTLEEENIQFNATVLVLKSDKYVGWE